MELRQVADGVLRSQMSPLIFLPTSISSRCQSISRRIVNSPHRRQLKRSFTSSTRSAIRSASVTTSSSKPPESPNGDTAEKPPSPVLKWLSSNAGASRTNPLNSAIAPTGNAPSSSSAPTRSELLMNKGNSADDLANAWHHVYSPSASSTMSSPFDRMATPYKSEVSTSVGDIMNDISKSVIAPPPPRPVMRLTPVTGRTVHVTQDVDLARSFKLLQTSCARNKIKKTFNYQRFHERPGLKRKRLKSERWRRRFMLGFKATVKRVKQMKKQGW